MRLAGYLKTILALRRLRFDRQELSGAFGDIGTDLPLLTGMIMVSGIDTGWAFLLFGILQIASALIYGIPMPVQPLKAVAALVIVQQIGRPIIAGGALAIAMIMLLLITSGAIDNLARMIPKPVIRGIQFGLGAKLCLLALGKYVQADGVAGYVLAAVCFVLVLVFLHHRRFPPAVVALLLGAGYATIRGVEIGTFSMPTLTIPTPSLPAWGDILMGFILLALPQVPLSLGNSLLATKQLADDWFPERGITLRRIGITFSLFNVIASFFGGIPVCHGAGGMAGHYVFGGRTGGSVAIYGAFYLILGLTCAMGFDRITAMFPLPVLGVILFFEALTLMARLQDVTANRTDLMIALVVGFAAVSLPYGFLAGMVIGGVLAAARNRLDPIWNPISEPAES